MLSNKGDKRKKGLSVTLKYERQPQVCFICGKLSHIDRLCKIPVMSNVHPKEVEHKVSYALCAPNKGQRKLKIGEKWL